MARAGPTAWSIPGAEGAIDGRTVPEGLAYPVHTSLVAHEGAAMSTPAAQPSRTLSAGRHSIKTDRLVFVGGLHRSGTTPLAALLAQHPEVAGLRDTQVTMDEGQYLQSVYPPTRSMGRFALDAEAHLTETSPLVCTDNASRLLSSWLPYWDTTKPFLLEKTPRNLVMGRFLQALFPGSALIAVVRHPIVVALALEKWNPWVSRKGRLRASFMTQMRNWVTAHRLLRDDAAQLPRLLVIRYEDLVSAPDVELSRIQDFLGLTSPLETVKLDRSRSSEYVAEWARRRKSANPWARWVARRVEREYAEELQSYGYDVRDLDRISPCHAFT
jgi:hypothetical protein